MKKRTYVLIIFLVIFILAAAAAFSYFLMDWGRPAVTVPLHAYLEINLSGELQEIAPPDFFKNVILGIRPLSMNELWMNIRKAKADVRVEAILLRLNFLECDWAKVTELRDAILDFRKAGKKAYAYIDEAPDFDKEYYLATACDRIILHPMGWLGINGIGGYVPFFKNALDKLGVRAEFEHVEEYKTTYNQFTEKGFTPAHKEMMESIYGDLFSHYIKAVASARKKSEEEVRGLIDRAFYQGENAVQAGLVDDLLYEDQLQNLLRSGERKLGQDHLRRLRPGLSGLGRDRHRPKGGPDLRGRADPQRGEPAPEHGRSDRRPLDPAGPPGRVHRRDCLPGRQPGRLLGGLRCHLARGFLGQEREALRRFDVRRGRFRRLLDLHGGPQDRSPTADPHGLHRGPDGQVRPFGLLREARPDRRKNRLRKGGRHLLDLPSVLTGRKEDHEGEILWTYDQFLTKVAEGRNMTRDEVDAVGRGRIWTGSQAKEIKLVDELGGLTEAVELAKSLAGIARERDVRLVVWPKKRTFWESLLGRRAPESLFDTRSGLKQAALALRLMKTNRIWAVMPFWSGPE